jgi:propanol-preferring alcohol dehydrogenase
MKAMMLHSITNLENDRQPLKLNNLPIPIPANNEILIKITTCGVCHTELDEIEGRTPPPNFPVIPGHQVVGEVELIGEKVIKYQPGDRVGIGWIFSSCGKCIYCRNQNENLCKQFKATGRDANGGYAEYMTVSENFAFTIPETFSDQHAAPLLCAGAIGYRSLRLTNLINGQNLGLTGFGASAHLVLKMVKHQYPDTNIFVFARNTTERQFAKELGAVWAGNTEEESPEKLHSIIDTTPVWKPVVEALKNLERNGRLVINAIRKEDIDKNYLLKLNYSTHLWQEKEIKSVANVAKNDIFEFLLLASKISIKPEVQEYSLEQANTALIELKQGKIRGAKVLKIN